MTDTIEDEQFEDVTDADVASAEQEAREAKELVASLEQRVESGDDTVSVDDIVEQEKLGRFARLRLTATRNKAERARVKRRLIAARALRDEILAEGSGIGGRLEKHLRTIAKAEAAFFDEVDKHNAKIADWKDRALALDIPVSNGAPVPPAEDGGIARGDGNFDLNVAGRHVGSASTRDARCVCIAKRPPSCRASPTACSRTGTGSTGGSPRRTTSPSPT